MSTPSLGPQSMSTRPIWEAPTRTKKMPPLKKFRLSKELVQQRVKDNVVIVTFGNYAFMDFILTWVKHLTDLGLSNLLIGKLPHILRRAFFFLYGLCNLYTFLVPLPKEKNVLVFLFSFAPLSLNLMA